MSIVDIPDILINKFKEINDKFKDLRNKIDISSAEDII